MACELDAEAPVRGGQRRTPLTTLTFGGLRLGEALQLAWRDIDLASGKMTVRASKTDAGERVIDLLAVLREELTEYRARWPARPDREGRVAEAPFSVWLAGRS